MNSNWTPKYDTISSTVNDSNVLNNKKVLMERTHVDIMALTGGSVKMIVMRLRSNASYNVASITA